MTSIAALVRCPAPGIAAARYLAISYSTLNDYDSNYVLKPRPAK
jgi:hypothetical protein